jgi:hypothetical protein
MNNSTDAFEDVRRDAQALHKKTHNATAVSHADIRDNLDTLTAEARQLKTTLRGLAERQRPDVKAHLESAATALDIATKDAKTLAAASDADLEKADAEMRVNSATALKHISLALAAKRSSLEARAQTG